MDIWKRFGEKEVSHSMAHYLQAVAHLKEAKGLARVGDIADHLGVSKSGVTSMLRSLAGRGFVEHERYGSVELTDEGRRLADRTRTNRRVLSVFLSEILGVPECIAEEDACMIEHLVTPQVMLEMLRLTAFVRSDHPAAEAFRAAYRDSPRTCRDHAPGSCELCGGSCLRDSLASEAAATGTDGALLGIETARGIAR